MISYTTVNILIILPLETSFNTIIPCFPTRTRRRARRSSPSPAIRQVHARSICSKTAAAQAVEVPITMGTRRKTYWTLLTLYSPIVQAHIISNHIILLQLLLVWVYNKLQLYSDWTLEVVVVIMNFTVLFHKYIHFFYKSIANS